MLEVLSPVTAPARIVCQGVNYGAHRVEAGFKLDRPGSNLRFTKADSTLTGAYGQIEKPSHVSLLDYEVELGLVIGKPIDGPVHITESNLHEYVAGRCCSESNLCALSMAASLPNTRHTSLFDGEWLVGTLFQSTRRRD